MRATVTQIGNSTGVILPKEAAARLKVKKGDRGNHFSFLTHLMPLIRLVSC